MALGALPENQALVPAPIWWFTVILNSSVMRFYNPLLTFLDTRHTCGTFIYFGKTFTHIK